jgi:hypothetical protein
MGLPMSNTTLLQQTQASLAALRESAETTHNSQLLDHIARLETTLAALLATGGAISVGGITGSTAVAIGHDINIIVNQVLPPALRQPWEAVQKAWGAAHLDIRALMERGQGQHVFLSYSRFDAEVAFTIRRTLESAGHSVWQDLTAIKGGDEWIKSIEVGVERCYALVTVTSAAARHSEWMQIEYLHAKRRGKLILPILVDDSEIPTLLLATHVIHAYPVLEPGLQQLIRALPAPPAIQPDEHIDQRALELRYLDSVLLEHSVWQEVYTPMAGVGQLRAPEKPNAPGRVRMKTAPTTIDVGYLGQKFALHPHDEQAEFAEPKHYDADIIPAVAEMRRLVILGDPGAGKTTTLWKLLSDYALKAKEDPRAPLPVLVRLGAWGDHDWPAAMANALGPLAEFCPALLRERRLAFLLDGLNELPAAQRDSHLNELRRWLADCQRDDLVVAVTCRELDYTGALDLGLPGRMTIMPLDVLRIRRFVNAHIDEPGKGDELFWQLAGGADLQTVWRKWQGAGASFELFWTAGDIPRENPNVHNRTSGQDDELWRDNVRDRKRSMLGLAANPYMLFMMTQVFTETGALPRNRGLLFQTFIDYLLEKRERLTPAVATELKTRLADLAYALQKAGGGTTFSSAEALKYLGFNAEQALYHARSANLLSGGDEARFTHQLLQEYFAAHHLQSLMARTPATALFSSKTWWAPQGWEETLILLAGLYNDDCTPVVEWLKDAQPEVAARCIAESGAHCPDKTLEAMRALWTPRLTDLKNDPKPEARAAVGRALGRLRLNGDPLDSRTGVSILTPLPTGRGAGGEVGLRLRLPDIDWVEIPSGPFIDQDGEIRSEPTFYIARYPITYAQFQTFLDDPQGFSNGRWWDGLAADDAHRRAPGEQAFKFANHPRERVSWYDAVAFCRWLTAQAQLCPQLLPEALRAKGRCEITLPTEWQWAKAARGHSTSKARAGRQGEYPYGDTFDVAKANTNETHIGQTNAVGIFPHGASPYGVLELSGNVWEWCLNEYDQPDHIGLSGHSDRVVRGGSWDANQVNARVASRGRDNPDLRDNDLGFRVGCRHPSL